MGFVIQWAGVWEFAFLTTSQVMLPAVPSPPHRGGNPGFRIPFCVYVCVWGGMERRGRHSQRRCSSRPSTSKCRAEQGSHAFCASSQVLCPFLTSVGQPVHQAQGTLNLGPTTLLGANNSISIFFKIGNQCKISKQMGRAVF